MKNCLVLLLTTTIDNDVHVLVLILQGWIDGWVRLLACRVDDVGVGWRTSKLHITCWSLLLYQHALIIN